MSVICSSLRFVVARRELRGAEVAGSGVDLPLQAPDAQERFEAEPELLRYERGARESRRSQLVSLLPELEGVARARAQNQRAEREWNVLDFLDWAAEVEFVIDVQVDYDHVRVEILDALAETAPARARRSARCAQSARDWVCGRDGIQEVPVGIKDEDRGFDVVGHVPISIVLSRPRESDSTRTQESVDFLVPFAAYRFDLRGFEETDDLLALGSVNLAWVCLRIFSPEGNSLDQEELAPDCLGPRAQGSQRFDAERMEVGHRQQTIEQNFAIGLASACSLGFVPSLRRRRNSATFFFLQLKARGHLVSAEACEEIRASAERADGATRPVSCASNRAAASPRAQASATLL